MGIGNCGFSWSSATSGILGLDLNFSTQGLNPNGGYYYGHGLPLRCLSE